MQRYLPRVITLSLGIGASIFWGGLYAPAVLGMEQSASAQTTLVAPPSGTIISLGVINSKALSKPQPAYPPIAMAKTLPQGIVVVQVIVDETGKVISAHATSGHPLLQQAAVQAANQARFAPIFLGEGPPLKVSGFLTYDFVLPKQHKPRSRRRH